MDPFAVRRVVIMGNAGAGKSTLAARMARDEGLAHLDLDTLAWLPGMPPRRAPLDESVARLVAFTDDAAARGWVIEGCYADLLAEAAARSDLLIFLDPGVEACVEHCRARPWEPHKYPSKEAQDANLEMLIAWVRDYETRSDLFSRRAHAALFDGFPGEKRRVIGA
jgi:adenylate kinase family enzyme